MKNIKLSALMVLAVLMVSTATAQTLGTSPNNFQAELSPGGETSQNISVSYTGESSVVAYLNHTILLNGQPSPEGFNIEYDKEPIVVAPGQPSSVNMTIHATTAIKPGDYNFKVTATTEIPIEKEIEKEYVDDDNGGSNTYYTTTVEGDLNKSKEEELKEKVNETVDQNLKLQKELEALRERLQELNSTDDSDRPAVNETQGNQTGNESTEFEPEKPDAEEATGFIQSIFQALFGWLS